MNRLRILHISDLHERAPFDGMPPERAARLQWDAEERGRLLGARFHEVLSQLAGNVDVVCFTGDIADWGHPAEYAAATKRVVRILDALGVGTDRFFAVPGNHDVQRGLAHQSWEAIRAWHTSSQDTGALGRWFRHVSGAPFGIDPAAREHVLQRTAAFWEWMGSMGRGALRPSAPKPLGYRSTLPRGAIPGLDMPVHFIGLDSAWLCGPGDDQGKILVTEEQAQGHLFESDSMLSGLRIALVHHPLDYLADCHEIRRLLVDAGVDLLLHGHQHVPTSITTEEHGARLRAVAAGCLVEGDLGKRWPNGFQLIELDVGRRVGRIDFRKWSSRGRFWAKGCDIYPEAPDGVLEWAHERIVEESLPSHGTAPPIYEASSDSGTSAAVLRRRCVIDPSLIFALFAGHVDAPLANNIMLACSTYEQLVFELAMGLSEYVGRVGLFAARHHAATRFRHLPNELVTRMLNGISPDFQRRLEAAVNSTAMDPDAIVAMAGGSRPPSEQLAYVARLFA